MGEIMDQAKGRIKQAVGSLIGDRGMTREGERDEAKGKAEGVVEDVKHSVKDAAKDVKHAVKDASKDVKHAGKDVGLS